MEELPDIVKLVEHRIGERRPYKLLSQHLTITGDVTGSIDGSADFSSAPVNFYIQPPKDGVYAISRLMVDVEDTNGFQAQEYGNLGAALTNGVQVCTLDDNGVIVDLTDPNDTIKTNAEWAAYCYDTELHSWGAGNEQLVARWSFYKHGAPIILEGKNNERLAVILNDNFTGLIEHHFVVQGLNFGTGKQYRRKDR